MYPCFKIVCNVRNCLLFGDAFRLKIDKGLPETRSPYRKNDEPANARRCLQPMYYPVSLCAASQHNETHGVKATQVLAKDAFDAINNQVATAP